MQPHKIRNEYLECNMQQRTILIIYTGGTIGMVEDPETGALKACDFEGLISHAPELKRIFCTVDVNSFNPIDSSDMNADVWVRIAKTIEFNYDKYDGFVVLHGTDTMSYSASALSYLLENLQKPVVFTGSQLPIGSTRTDAKENLITAVEIAATYEDDLPLVPEVSLLFEDQLYRGNRTHKTNAEHFDAFHSFNYPALANVGVRVKFQKKQIEYPTESLPLIVRDGMDNRVAALKLFPGIREEVVRAMINIPDLQALVLETYGAGNAPTAPWFLEAISEGIKKGLIIANVSQCQGGGVDQGRYEASRGLKELGVISAADITFEAAITKLMYLLTYVKDKEELKVHFSRPLRGELSI